MEFLALTKIGLDMLLTGGSFKCGCVFLTGSKNSLNWFFKKKNAIKQE